MVLKKHIYSLKIFAFFRLYRQSFCKEIEIFLMNKYKYVFKTIFLYIYIYICIYIYIYIYKDI